MTKYDTLSFYSNLSSPHILPYPCPPPQTKIACVFIVHKLSDYDNNNNDKHCAPLTTKYVPHKNLLIVNCTSCNRTFSPHWCQSQVFLSEKNNVRYNRVFVVSRTQCISTTDSTARATTVPSTAIKECLQEKSRFIMINELWLSLTVFDWCTINISSFNIPTSKHHVIRKEDKSALNI